MNKFLLITLYILLFIPNFTTAQSKRKKLRAEAEANAVIENNLRMHIQALTGNARPVGDTDLQKDQFDVQYITELFKQLEIDPAGTNGYIQEFEIDEGKQVITAATFLKINEKQARITTDFFPLAYSAVKNVKGMAAVALKESSQPWFTDLKEVIEENQGNLHFDMDDYIKKEARKIVKRGATALILYNSSSENDHIQFSKKDKSAACPIPILYITKEGMKKYCSDISATLNIDLGIAFKQMVRKEKNIVGFINNHAATSVILAVSHDCVQLNKTMADTDSTWNKKRECAYNTAALIELARLIKKAPLKNNNYLLLHYPSGTADLMGFEYWLEHPTRKITPNCAINMAIKGDFGADPQLIVSGLHNASEWNDVFALAGTNTHLAVKLDQNTPSPVQSVLSNWSIPALYFSTENHSVFQGLVSERDKLICGNERQVLQHIYKLIAAMDEKGKLTLVKMQKPVSDSKQ